MKWSQAICASILVDSFYAIDGLSPRAVNREFRPNQLTPDWDFHLSPLQPGPQAGRQASPESVVEGQTRLTIDS